MRQDTIRAERALARHCRELVERQVEKADAGEALVLLGHRVAAALPAELAPLAGGIMPAVTAGDPVDGFAHTLLAKANGPACHRVLAGSTDACRLLVSTDARALFELVDRAFGGDGDVPDPLPARLPVSAELLLSRIEAIMAELIGRIAAGGALAAPRAEAGGGDIALLRPFAANCPLHQIGFSIRFAEGPEWLIRLTMPAAAIAALWEALGDNTAPARAAPAPAPRTAADRPFADIPLTLTATLVDMALPLARLSGLKPGDILPVSIARHVPVTIGEQLIAHGTVGEMDDRVALQLGTRTPAPALPKKDDIS
ncbi:FliM/FliN family flagellar motor switch protein [Croceicoccus mobilis]|uniref:Flagellar motor switch protein FliN-like C-terminal domain-containing protein n=1 Tax=Croceicoccus mobilis TaxID=1703339 RepID=A0A917DT50_9SPHN|nr:flagellar motor switch protein FliM [Croceicoccus mobilis]GGD64279.1 hypothetical protein GCM10010990_12170 [Croceicoccus mobilis]